MVIFFSALKISDIGSNWVYLDGCEAKVECADGAGSEQFDVPGIISLTLGNTYTCSIIGSDNSLLTFKLGKNRKLHNYSYN
jgi:hypothetical protein